MNLQFSMSVELQSGILSATLIAASYMNAIKRLRDDDVCWSRVGVITHRVTNTRKSITPWGEIAFSFGPKPRIRVQALST
jgi:hypothetical protein